jgi:RNA polymerase sigma-70 factor (ECF subfamily)
MPAKATSNTGVVRRVRTTVARLWGTPTAKSPEVGYSRESVSDPADYDLLEAWRGGDRNAADLLMRRHYASVLRFFEVRTRAADDLTQRTFLACIESQPRFRGDSTFRAYLFGIARRTLLRHLGDAQRLQRQTQFDAPDPQHKTSLSVLFARHEEHQILLRALSGLPEDRQSVLVLFYWEGMMAKEIAEVLEVVPSTITTRLARARDDLRHRIRKQARPGRAHDALLEDLEPWLRSLAGPDARRVRPPAFPRRSARARDDD